MLVYEYTDTVDILNVVTSIKNTNNNDNFIYNLHIDVVSNTVVVDIIQTV